MGPPPASVVEETLARVRRLVHVALHQGSSRRKRRVITNNSDTSLNTDKLTLLQLRLLEAVPGPDLVLGDALARRVTRRIVDCRQRRRRRGLRRCIRVAGLDVAEEFEEYPL